ncbi:MAG: hypothetical protein JW797_16500 [Bradymonadales bacterium]|nr:hypothetical protein [Bradymonadales bacterium]
MADKKKYPPRAALSDQRLAELKQSLEEGAIPPCTPAELKGFADHLVRSEEADLLGTLYSCVSGKERRKIVTQALFRLEKRGVPVPAVRTRPPAIELTRPQPEQKRPILMSQPELNGERLFYFPHTMGQAYLLVKAAFHRDHGLAILSAEETSHSHWNAMVRGLTSKLAASTPQGWVIADAPLLQRKLWEMGTFVRSGRIGQEVDRELCSRLLWPQQPPSHPVADLDLDAVAEADEMLLFQTVEALRPLADDRIFDTLARNMREAADSPLVLSESQQAARYRDLIQAAVDQQMASWGAETLVEIMLDAAYYLFLGGSASIAKTLRQTVTAASTERRELQLRNFLETYLEHLFIRGDVGSPDGPKTSPGGIILP